MKEMLNDHPFFSEYFDFSGCGWHNGKCAAHGGYDPAWSTLMGAQINQPKFFNSTVSTAASGALNGAFGPWEQSAGAIFY